MFKNEEQQIVASPSASFWIKKAIQELSNRDLVDAYYDVEALRRIMRERMINAGMPV